MLDFGLVRAIDHEDISSVSERGATMGTVGYMSPEQARGDEVDHRTDLFSLGCVLFEMCTGERPFSGREGWAIIQELLHGEPKQVDDFAPELPKSLRQLIDGLLSNAPSDRPSSAHEVRATLAGVATGSGARPKSGRSVFGWLFGR